MPYQVAPDHAENVFKVRRREDPLSARAVQTGVAPSACQPEPDPLRPAPWLACLQAGVSAGIRPHWRLPLCQPAHRICRGGAPALAEGSVTERAEGAGASALAGRQRHPFGEPGLRHHWAGGRHTTQAAAWTSPPCLRVSGSSPLLRGATSRQVAAREA